MPVPGSARARQAPRSPQPTRVGPPPQQPPPPRERPPQSPQGRPRRKRWSFGKVLLSLFLVFVLFVGAVWFYLDSSITRIDALPDDLSGKVDYLEVRTVDTISLVLRNGRTILWGSAEDSANKAEVLDVLLDRKAQVYDVSVPGQPTITC